MVLIHRKGEGLASLRCEELKRMASLRLEEKKGKESD